MSDIRPFAIRAHTEQQFEMARDILDDKGYSLEYACEEWDPKNPWLYNYYDHISCDIIESEEQGVREHYIEYPSLFVIDMNKYSRDAIETLIHLMEEGVEFVKYPDGEAYYFTTDYYNAHDNDRIQIHHLAHAKYYITEKKRVKTVKITDVPSHILAAAAQIYPYLRLDLEEAEVPVPTKYEAFKTGSVTFPFCYIPVAKTMDERNNSTNTVQKTTENTMKPANSMFGNLRFGQIDNIPGLVVTPFGIGAQNGNGTFAYDKTNEKIIDVGDFVIEGFPIIGMPVVAPEVGDVLLLNDKPVYVAENGKTLIVVDFASQERITKVPTTNILGFNLYTKLFSMGEFMMNSVIGGEQPANGVPMLGGMNPMMLMFMMGGSDKSGGGLLGGGGKNNMMEMMMMMSMFGGGQNPFQAMLGNATPAAPKKTVARKAAPKKAATRKTAASRK